MQQSKAQEAVLLFHRKRMVQYRAPPPSMAKNPLNCLMAAAYLDRVKAHQDRLYER